jgi:hypothetical protein
MFPKGFARRAILKYTDEGDWVLDPFCGRGTATFEAATAGRNFTGIEIGPIGWIYAKTKANPATKEELLARLNGLKRFKAKGIPCSEFFRMAYCLEVRRFLAIAKAQLNWRRSHVDRTLMSFILIHLHDHVGVGLSNQMQQAKAVHPDYAVRWWTGNGYKTAPAIDPYALLTRKIEWRYKKGTPSSASKGQIYLGDARKVVAQLNGHKHGLLLTSPPYQGVTNYSADQWLRLWLVGENPTQGQRQDRRECRGRFHSREKYESLLRKVFSAAKPTLKRNAVIYVRTDARAFTRKCTREVLKEVFPSKTCRERLRPIDTEQSQTRLYGDKDDKPGEVDFVLTS